MDLLKWDSGNIFPNKTCLTLSYGFWNRMESGGWVVQLSSGGRMWVIFRAQLLLRVEGRGQIKGPHMLPPVQSLGSSILSTEHTKMPKNEMWIPCNIVQFGSTKKFKALWWSILNYSVEIRKVVNLFQNSEVVTLRKTYRMSPWSSPGMVHHTE